MAKILIVEDETAINELVYEILADKGHEVMQAYDGLEGYQKFTQNQFELIITDIMMDNMDGKQLTKLIRKENKKIPIVMLTAKITEEDEIEGFDIGVDEYIKKPFSIDVFIKRIEAQLKKVQLENIYEDKISCENITLDLKQFIAFKNQKEIQLTLKEFKILEFLMSNPNQVLSRERIIEQVWGFDYYGDLRIVDTHIKNLRKKMELENIKTIKGIGYNFNVK